jgi:crotonobetainyl-CoA:carnitine CoA-transferase CaiB-like acyl-CoA transferase
MAKLEKTGLPFAPITRPEDLFDDAHLNASGGLVDVTVPDGEFKGAAIRLPALPLEMNGQRFGAHIDVPRVGQYSKEVLAELGYSSAEIDAMIAAGAVGSE